MSAVLRRAFEIVEALVGHPEGLSLGTVARQLAMPKSAMHRLLADLVDLGYVRQDASTGNYIVGLPVVALGLRHLRSISLVEAAAPALVELAEESGELARLSIFDGTSLVWVAKQQGARPGLRYDPDSGEEVTLATTATGIAWLSTFPDEDAVALANAQRTRREENGVAGEELNDRLADARRRGFAYADGTYEVGLAGVAVPVALPGRGARAAISVAGPSFRFPLPAAEALVRRMIELAVQLAPLAEHEVERTLDRWR